MTTTEVRNDVRVGPGVEQHLVLLSAAHATTQRRSGASSVQGSSVTTDLLVADMWRLPSRGNIAV